jgi:hypothetical protein
MVPATRLCPADGAGRHFGKGESKLELNPITETNLHSVASHPRHDIASAARISQFKTIVEAVTNELLQWTIELQKRGIKGEDMDFNDKDKQAATHQVFNIQKVVGVAGNVHGSQVTVYDYGSINGLLIDHQVPKPDRRELEDIMDEMKDAAPEKKKTLLQRAEAWVVKHKDLLGAGAEAVGKAIGSALKG